MNQETPSPETEDRNPVENTVSSTSVPIKLPERRAYMAYSLLGITITAFALQFLTDFLLQTDYLVLYGAKINQRISAGELWRLFTPIFLHGSFLHIAFNMYAMSILGPRLERFYGHWRFLLLYVLSGFGGNVFSMMFTDAPSLGSSTAIFGLIGAQGVFYYHNRKIFGASFRRALNGIITIAAVNLIIGLSPGIDNWGHIGGLLGGVVFSWLGGPLLEVTGVFPDMTLSDRRETNEVIQGVGIVAGFFSLLVAGALYLMR